MTRALSALALALCGALVAAPAAAQEEARDPAHEAGEPLWMSGLTLLTATYVLTGATSTTLVMVANAREGTIVQSWIPVVGPFLMLADSAGYDTAQLAFTGISAALQVLGLAALVTGIVLDAQAGPGSGTAALRLAPLAGPSGSGLALIGTF